MKNLNEDLINSETKVIKESIADIDYKMEYDRLWKENYTQKIIIKALVFYIQEVKE